MAVGKVTVPSVLSPVPFMYHGPGHGEIKTDSKDTDLGGGLAPLGVKECLGKSALVVV